MNDGTFIICVNKEAIPREDLITLSKDFDIVKEANELMDGKRGGGNKKETAEVRSGTEERSEPAG